MMVNRVEYRDDSGSTVSFDISEFLELPFGSRNRILVSDMIEFYDEEKNPIEADKGRKLVFNLLYK